MRPLHVYSLSGGVSMVVAYVARSIPGWAETAPMYTMLEGGTAHESGGATSQLDRQSLSASTSFQLSFLSILLLVVDNWPHILW